MKKAILSHKKYVRLLKLSCALLALTTQSALAANNPTDSSSSFWFSAAHPFSMVFSLSAGPVWTKGGTTQTIYSQPTLERAYIANQQNQTLASGELFWGVQHDLSDLIQAQVGLAVATTSAASFSGDIWDDADPAFDNFTYHYQLRHTHLALKGKLIGDLGALVKPYMSGSAGIAWNRASNYTNTPTIPQARAMPNFGNHTSTAFTYTIGAGLEYALTSHMEVGLGYEFTDWGKSQLSAAPGQTLNSGLSLKHTYTNGLLLNITYLI